MSITSARLELLRQAQQAVAALEAGAAPAPTAEREQAARESLRDVSFFLAYDRDGQMTLRELPRGIIILRPDEVPGFIDDPMGGTFPRPLLIPIIQACLRRLGLVSVPVTA